MTVETQIPESVRIPPGHADHDQFRNRHLAGPARSQHPDQIVLEALHGQA
jgi:hypothetical protein